MVLQNKKEIHKKFVFHGERKKLYNEYSNSLKKTNLSEETIEWRLKHIRGFLNYIDKKNKLIKNVTPEVIYDYIISINCLSLRTIENRTVCLRLFFDWLFKQNYSSYSGKLLFPKIVRKQNNNIISYYTKEEITRLINSIDNTLIDGKRDLFVILMFAYLGIRLKDIKNLKIHNFDFQNNIIKITQHKTKSTLILSLLGDIKYALLDYLKAKKNNTEYLINDQYGNACNEDTIYNIVKKCFINSKIKINGRKMGPHALRHSLATLLINNDVGIYNISNILGHDNVDSTKTYVKVNIERLKKLSLEVPEWKI